MSWISSSDVAVTAAGGLAELTRLRNRERELVEELRSVRLASRAQIDTINDFFKQHKLPPPITRLPLSVLSDIIHRAICDTLPESDAHYRTKRQLASVSRRWRDAILHSPNFWTTIAIHPSWSTSLVKTHVKRSRECPLDIRISNWTSEHAFSTFSNLLGVVVTCGYRWRNLVIWENDEDFADYILNSIKHLMFSSLRSVEICGEVTTSHNLPFLTSGYAPGLEHLVLSTNSIEQVPAATNLQSLRFSVDDGSGSHLLSSLLPLQQLTKLVLGGSSDQWPEPQSIHLPVLTSLTLVLLDPKPALAAVVVPNLIYLECVRPSDSTCDWTHIFGSFPDMFPRVRHLCLSGKTPSPPSTTAADAWAICRACPGVRHAELLADDIGALCLLLCADFRSHREHSY